MGWLSGFTLTILCVIILTFLCNAMMPDSKLSSYVNLVLGLVVTITIIDAALGVRNISFDEVFAFENAPEISRENAALTYNASIAQKFQENLQDNIQAYIQNTFSQHAQVSVRLQVNADGNVAGIDTIDIITHADAGQVQRQISAQYGVRTDVITVRSE